MEAPEITGPSVSVVVVSQNQSQLLKPTLQALSARENPSQSEVIVVDCGSTDGSARLDEEFEGITMMRLPRNFGWTKAVNIGSRTAKGERLLLLPNGCEIAPDTIDRMVAALDSDHSVGAVSVAGTFYALPKPGDVALREVPPSAAEYPFDQPVLLPRVTLVSMNYLPDGYGQYFGDAELFYKMREAGKRVLVLEDLSIPRKRAQLDSITAELAEADRLSGLGAFYSKNYGFMAGFSFWLGQSLKALFAFKLGLAGKLLGGTKVDGL
ncbi:glycosyltransferase [Bryobacter aggregatus]|uniref:glycosyltransferase n=1 Tax=Bryobacter aggregatus TaxID=360054 RepID=UPI0004E19246|nr:glycosyltransferase [Bryobacter aggregatus]